jgi:hypothetical protein
MMKLFDCGLGKNEKDGLAGKTDSVTNSMVLFIFDLEFPPSNYN